MGIFDRFRRKGPEDFPDIFIGWDNYRVEEVRFPVKAEEEGREPELELYYRVFLPHKKPTEPAALLVMIPGWNEHSGNYRHFASYFAAQKMITVVPDLRGHGQSEGERGHVEDFNDYVRDMEALLRRLYHRFKGVPLLLGGHSMGALVAIRLLQTLKPGPVADSVKGLFVSSPLIQNREETPRLRRTVGRLVEEVWPKWKMKQEDWQPEKLTGDERRWENYRQDPMRHHVATVRLKSEIARAANACLEDASFMTLPVLVSLGGADQISDIDGAQTFFDIVRSEKKSLQIYPKYGHDLYQEKNNMQVFESVHKWLEKDVLSRD